MELELTAEKEKERALKEARSHLETEHPRDLEGSHRKNRKWVCLPRDQHSLESFDVHNCRN